LPYLGALALAIAACAIWHADLHHESWTSDTWAARPSLGLVLQHIAFIGRYNSNAFDPPIWSLVVEMRISLLFPLVWLAVDKLVGWKAFTLPVLLTTAAALMIHGRPETDGIPSPIWTVHFLGVFVVGILLAKYYRRLLPVGWRMKAVLAVSSVVVLFYGSSVVNKVFITPVLHTVNSRAVSMAEDWIIVAGAGGIMLSAIAAPGFLHGRVPLFFGRISYSLYLIHYIVLLALASTVGSLSLWLEFPIYVLMSLAVATIFCFCVEEPAMRWGRSLTGGSKALREA